MTNLEKLLDRLRRGERPPMILVGGNSDFLVESAYRRIRDEIQSDRATSVEMFPEGADLSSVIDSYRTFSLFGGKRLLLLPEMNAFVTRKELHALLDKAAADWSSAKTDRKRSSSVAKLLHVLGLAGLDLEMSDAKIANVLGETKALAEMLAFARTSGKKASRGEGDAALLAEAAARGGSPGTTLLMRTGDMPDDSATVASIASAGAVIRCDLERDRAVDVIRGEIAAESQERKVRFPEASITRLLERLGVQRMLADKFNREIPDVRTIVSEAERLMTLAGDGGVVDPGMVDQQIHAVTGGARYELGGLFAERKGVEALEKLRDLVHQSRRDDPKTSIDIHYGKFLFPLADEIRQLLGVISYARLRKIDLRAPMPYNRFKDLLADPLSNYLKDLDLVRQRPHPFALHKKWEAARRFRDTELWDLLRMVGRIESARKIGGVAPEVSLEALLLSAGVEAR